MIIYCRDNSSSSSANGVPLYRYRIGLGTEFRSKKTPRNRLGTVSIIPRKKALILRHSEFRGRANSEARNGTEWNRIPRKKSVLRTSKVVFSDTIFEIFDCHVLLSWFLFHGIPKDCFYFLLHGKEFRVVFSFMLIQTVLLKWR